MEEPEIVDETLTVEVERTEREIAGFDKRSGIDRDGVSADSGHIRRTAGGDLNIVHVVPHGFQIE